MSDIDDSLVEDNLEQNLPPAIAMRNKMAEQQKKADEEPVVVIPPVTPVGKIPDMEHQARISKLIEEQKAKAAARRAAKAKAESNRKPETTQATAPSISTIDDQKRIKILEAIYRRDVRLAEKNGTPIPPKPDFSAMPPPAPTTAPRVRPAATG